MIKLCLVKKISRQRFKNILYYRLTSRSLAREPNRFRKSFVSRAKPSRPSKKKWAEPSRASSARLTFFMSRLGSWKSLVSTSFEHLGFYLSWFLLFTSRLVFVCFPILFIFLFLRLKHFNSADFWNSKSLQLLSKRFFVRVAGLLKPRFCFF